MTLDPKKGMGPDNIHPRLLLSTAQFIAEPLCYIFNLSFSTGIFPDDLKIANVLPLFKSGSTDDPNNYRPISILPCISKLLEKIVHSQLYSHLHCSGLLSSQQSGFRPKHSTSTSLHFITEKCLHSLNNNQVSGIISFDIRKAFDSVKHNILINKLLSGSLLLLTTGNNLQPITHFLLI